MMKVVYGFQVITSEMQENDMKKQRMLSLVGLLLLAAVMLGVWFVTRPDPVDGMKHITVEVIHADGSEKSWEYDTDAEYLGAFLEEEGLIEGAEGPYGIYVHTVDGERAVYEENGCWWGLNCDGESAATGADQVIIEDGRTYTWIYSRG